MLSTKNLELWVICKKLVPKFIRPFRVLKLVRPLVYCLALLTKYNQLYNVFLVSLLELWYSRPGARKNEMLMPDLEDDEEWEVEEIRNK